MNQLLTKNFKAEAAITKYRIVKLGAGDEQVLQGAAATDALIGVSHTITAAIDERIDVVVAGIADVELGGTVTRGGFVSSDATGRGVAPAPAAGVNNAVIGRALASGVIGDIIPVLVSPSQIQG